MEIKLPHNLPQDVAVTRIKSLFNNVKEHSGNTISNISQTWSGNEAKYSFTAKGLNISGNMQVSPLVVVLNLKLPFAAMLFKGKIRSIIEQEAKKVLS